MRIDMSAMQLWMNMMGIRHEKFIRFEVFLFEAEIFLRVCEEIKSFFKDQQKEFFRLVRYSDEMSNTMLETEFLRLMICDILATGEYNIEGIACYANTHTDVVQEVVMGMNLNPSAKFFQRIVSLHRSVRRELYQMILKKILIEVFE